METIAPSPVLVIEIPDAGGRGHRFLTPEAPRVAEAEAIALTSSIHGCVHVSRDRIGISRGIDQRTTLGTRRDATIVAVVAGLDVSCASPDQVIAALSTLEKCLDAAIDEAATTASTAYTVMPSRVATEALATIRQIGFRQRALDLPQAPPAHTAQPGPSASPASRPIKKLPLLAGTLAALTCGITIGWIAAMTDGGRPLETGVAPMINSIRGRPEEPDHGDDQTPASLQDLADVSAPKPAHDAESDRPDHPPERSVDSVDRLRQEEIPSSLTSERPLVAMPHAVDTGDVWPGFHIDCTHTAEGDQLQLFLKDTDKSVGKTLVATGRSCSFEGPATEGLTSPAQLEVHFWPAGHSKPLRTSLNIVRGQGTCTFDVPAPRGEIERTVRVTVFPQLVSTEVWRKLPSPPLQR